MSAVAGPPPTSMRPLSSDAVGLSLAARLILSSLLLTIIGLLITGVILTSLYRSSAEAGFDARLETYANALIGDLAAQSGLGDTVVLSAPENIAEPRFLEPLSGWYWQVADADTVEDAILFASDSLFGSSLNFLPESHSSAIQFANQTGPGGAALRQWQRSFLLPGDRSLVITVTGNLTALNADIAAFRSSLILTFLTFAAFLAAAIYGQVRLGLRPLQAIQSALRRVQAGDAEQIDGVYPGEIAPVVDEVNNLIIANKAVVERARTQVGNLAHGLKTPLSVIANEAQANTTHTDAAGQPIDGAKLIEQVQLMRNQIDHYLARARTAAGLSAVGTLTDVKTVAEGLARAMRKIHQDKQLDITVDIPVDLQFRGERQDLEELVGNLLDNASKWAKQRVILKGDQHSPRQILLKVQDDGPGLSETERIRALRRGQRLDETIHGSGLGLSIVQETVDLYEGSLRLGRANLGGLEAEIRLPGTLRNGQSA